MSSGEESGRVLTWDSIWVGRHPGAFMDVEGIDVELDYAHRFHELRGLVMAQVGEIEDLIQRILVRLQNSSGHQGAGRRSKQQNMTAGQALGELRFSLGRVGRTDEFASQLDLIGRAIKKRNMLVHGRIHVGTAAKPPEVVMVLLVHSKKDDGREPCLEDDIDEGTLLRVLDLARRATEATVDIWEAFNPIGED